MSLNMDEVTVVYRLKIRRFVVGSTPEVVKEIKYLPRIGVFNRYMRKGRCLITLDINGLH